MQGDVEAHRQRVRLQLCATTAISQAGKAFWSDSVQLDALGGAAVVEAPCPMTAVTPSLKEAQAGYRLAVTAVQVQLLHNTRPVNADYVLPCARSTHAATGKSCHQYLPWVNKLATVHAAYFLLKL